MAASMTPSDDVHAYSSGKNACPQSVISAKPSQYRHQDQNFLMFDTCTPSLTTGSTRSTASSTSACEHCLLADLDCQCLNHSDLEGMCQQQGYEYVVVCLILIKISRGVISFDELEKINLVANFHDC